MSLGIMTAFTDWLIANTAALPAVVDSAETREITAQTAALTGLRKWLPVGVPV